MMTLGMRPDSTSREFGRAEQVGHLVQDDLDDHLPGRQRLHDVGADGLLANLGDELLDDLVVHVGLEQRHANLAHGRVDIGLGEAALAGQIREDRLETVGEVVEHESSFRGVTYASARHTVVSSGTSAVKSAIRVAERGSMARRRTRLCP